jgi:hypothetical protein
MLQFLSRDLNPIFVKEIRQFVRSNFIAVLVNLYIFLLVFAFLSFLSAFGTSNNDMFVVKSFWLTVCYIVLWTCFFSVIVRTVWSTSVERNNSDLMFYSSIKPSAIVYGKFLTGAVTTFILMSITMPFVVLLNLMGGTDLKYMVLVLMEIFVIVQLINALAILIASIFKMSFAPFISLFLTLIAFGFAHFWVTRVIEYWEDIEQQPERLFEIIGFFIFEIILFILFFCAAIAKFSPKKSNRSFHVRLVATVIFIIITFVSILFISLLDAWLFIVVFLSFYILMFFLPTVVCENDQWTTRIRQGLPKSLFLRFIMFPFYTGSACGLAWIGLMTAVLMLVDLSILFPLSSNGSLFGSIIQDCKCRKIVLLFIFVFDICVTAMLIRSWFLKQLQTSRVWMIAILVLFFVTFGSIIVAGIYFAFYDVNVVGVTNLNSTWWTKYQNSAISSINPFMLLVSSHSMFWSESLSPMIVIGVIVYLIVDQVPLSRCYGAIVWADILLSFLLVWYLQRLKNFSPYNIEEPLSYEEAKEAAENPTNTDPANQKIILLTTENTEVTEKEF